MNWFTRGFYYGLMNLQYKNVMDNSKVFNYCDGEYLHIPSKIFNLHVNNLEYKKIYYNDEWDGVTIKIRDYKLLFYSPTTYNEKVEWLLGYVYAQNNKTELKVNNKKSYKVVTKILWDIMSTNSKRNKNVNYKFSVNMEKMIWALTMDKKWIRSFLTCIYIDEFIKELIDN